MSGPGTLTHFNRMSDYVNALAATNPSEALQIALAETERAKAMAEQAQAEYRAMAEVKFDSKGRIAEANLAGLYRLAAGYAKSRLVPDHYQNKYKPDGTLTYDATPDCFIAVQMAFRLGVDPLAYMQASFIVHGKPGIEAKLATALLNTSGKILGRIRYKDTGTIKDKTRACTAYVTDKETGETVEATVDWAMVEAEGWLAKTGSKWKTMPDVMIHYRSAVFLIRQYYSEVLMGIQTVDELQDMHVETAPPASSMAELTARIEGPANGHAEPDDAQEQVAGDAGTTDRPEDNPSTDANLIEEATAAAAAITAELSIQVFLDEYLPKCGGDDERSIVQGLAADAKQRVIDAREARNKAKK